MRRCGGWPRASMIPSEATFSRAFAEFSEARLAERLHEALVKDALGGELIGHVSRDSTAIEAREKRKPKTRPKPPRKRGRPRKGEEGEKEPGRLERQSNGMSLEAMLDDLPKACDHGAKRNAKGFLVLSRTIFNAAFRVSTSYDVRVLGPQSAALNCAVTMHPATPSPRLLVGSVLAGHPLAALIPLPPA